MKLNHRQLVRHASYLARHPNTRRLAIAISLIVFLASLTITQPTEAANHAVSVNSKTQWEYGTLTNVDNESTTDGIQMVADGTWTGKTLAEAFDTFEVGATYTSDGTYVYASRGGYMPWFWRYDPVHNTWLKLADAPFPFGTGSDFKYASNGNYIYALFGNYQIQFARYSIATNTWQSLANVPDVIYTGASLAYDSVNNKIYMLRANSSSEFYRYTPDSGIGAWQTISGPGVNFGAGADLFYSQKDGTNYLFAIQGANGLKTYRYNIDTPGWADAGMADLPSGQTINEDHNGILYNGEFYTPRGASQTWMKYTVATDAWTVWSAYPSMLPLSVNAASGIAYSSATNRVYVFRGNSSRYLWAWNPTSNTWDGNEDPIISNTAYTMTTGTRMVSDGNRYLYVLRGGANTLMQYDTQASAGVNPWSVISTGGPSVSLDTYGVLVNGYFYFMSAAATLYRVNVVGTPTFQPTTLSAPYNSFGNGGGFVYPGSGTTVYALRGNGGAGFYSFDTSSWPPTFSDTPADLPQTNQATVANFGGRLFMNSTDVYAILGNSSNRIMRYNIVGNAWYEDVTPAPFPSYYGTTVATSGNLAYIFAGYYKNDFYEFNMSTGAWRKLKDVQLAATANLGPYSGSALAIMGSSVFGLRGGTTTDFYTYTISANKYVSSATYESQIYDLGYVSSWTSLTTSGASTPGTTPNNTAITITTNASSDGITWDGAVATTGTTINSNPKRYLKVGITLAAGADFALTPSLLGYSVNYVGDSTAPANPDPAYVTGKDQEGGSITLTTGNSYGYTSPYFSWPAEDATGGATDNGSGIKGYYVYFGTNAAANPADSASGGSFTANNFYEVNTPMSTGTYYLRIRAVDNDNTPADSTITGFTYVYNGVSPSSQIAKTTQGDFTAGTLTDASATQSTGNLQLTSTPGWWKQDSIPPVTANVYQGGVMIYRPADGLYYVLVGSARTMYSYNPTTNTWSAEGTMPGATNVGLGGGIVLGPGNYLYGWLGNNTSTFMRYDTSTNTWDDAEDISANLSVAVSSGASAVYDNYKYIYFKKGTSDDAFWRYDTSLNTWESLQNTIYGNGSGTNTANTDNQIVFDGNRTIYAVQGSGYPYFGKFVIPENMDNKGSWTALKPGPVSFTTGSTMVYDSISDSIYATGGNAREQLVKYSVSTDSWTILTPPPMSIGYGTSMAMSGTEILVLRGNNTTAVWKYDTVNNVWNKPVTGVFGSNPSYNLIGTYVWRAGVGARIVKGDGDYYYATRGDGDNTFIRYNYKTSESVFMQPLPMGVTTGSSIIYTGSYVYATTGSNSQNFYKYTISTNTWERVNTASADLVPGSLGDGSDLAYDGTQYIYLTRGATGAQVYRFDTLAGSSRWSTSAVPNSTAAAGAGGNLIYANDPGDSKNYLFMARGASLSFYQWEIGGASWSDPLAADPTGAAVAAGGSLSNGLDGYLYLSKGSSGTPPTQWYRYYIAGNTWEVLNNAPAGWGTGGTMSGKNGEQIVGFLGQGTNAVQDGIYTYTQQTSTSSFKEAGTYLSETLDMSPSSDMAPYKWGNLTASFTKPTNTSIVFKTQSSTDGSSWSDLEEVVNEHADNDGTTHRYQIVSPVRQYLRVQVTLSSDGVYSPTLGSYEVNYYLDETAPTNPSEGHGYSASGGTELNASNWQKYTNPQFTWPAAGASNGAADNAGGSGVSGYYLYFGTSSSGNPVSSSGIINASGAVYTQTTNELIITNGIKDRMTQGQTYYLNLKAYDGAGNKAGTSYTIFTYKYDSNPPPTPGAITPNPLDYTTGTTWTFTWSAAGDNSGESGLYKYQYRTGEDGADTWYDVDPLTSTTVTLPNANHPNSKYTDGTNDFFLRVVDNAGNASTTPREGNYYYFGTAPSTVTNLDVSPETGYTNSFTATWGLPTHYVGDESMLRYRYSIGDLPDPYNTVELSSRAVGPTALANKYGTNTIYVVAYYNGTDISSIPWGTYATKTFTAYTSAPTAPRNMRLADTSERDLEEYSAAIKWERPTSYNSSDPDFAGFKIYRSLNGTTFGEPIATTTGTAYVDDGLSNTTTYYYKVTAYTKSGQESDPSDTKNILPTGKYSQPPTIITSSVKSSIFSKRVIFDWITTRTKGSGEGTSFAKCGRSLDNLDLTNGTFDQVIQHQVTVEGFTPNTAYICNLYSTDIDGNTAVYGPINLTTAPPSTIKDVEVSNITLTEALLTWETSVPAKGKLYYFENVNNKQEKEFPSYQTSFSVKLSGLRHTTTYNYSFYLTSEGDDKDVFGQDVTNTFNTLPEPVVTNLVAEPVLGVDTPTIKVTYLTNVDTTAVVYYSTPGTQTKEASNSTPMAKNHEVTISGMLPLKTYTLTARGSDAFGNLAVEQTIFVTTKDDTKPPEVTTFVTDANPQTDGKTILIAKVQANEPATAQMEVATGAGATTFPIIGQESPLNQAHSLSVTVNAGTIYTVRVKLTDSAGNVTYSKSAEVSGGLAKDTAIKIVTKTLSNHFSWFINILRRK